MKKCCLNCAFCMRCQDKRFYVCGGVYDDNTKELLYSENRKQALSMDFSFLNAEKRAQKKWEKEYNQKLDNMKKGMYNEQLGGPCVLDYLQTQSMAPVDTFPLTEIFGMSPHPKALDADYLSCWHNLWNFKDKEKELSTLNDKNDCLFFYPYNKKGNKSFEGCEKEREALLAKSRFMTTNWLVILGIFVTILIFAIQTWNNRQTIQTQEIIEIMSPDTSSQPGGIIMKGAQNGGN